MDTYPVLKLLAREEEPPFRILQSTAASLAGNPDLLADLMGQDLSDDLLGLLETRAARFSSILLELGAHIIEKNDFSEKFTPFARYLVRSTKDILDETEYHGLLSTALRLCPANRNRWQLVKEIAYQGQTLEHLILSAEGHSHLLQWFLSIKEDGADALILTDWTRRIVALVDACSSDHGISATLSRWRKIESLSQALRKVIDGDSNSTQSSRIPQNSKAHLENTIFDHETSLLFIDFNLPIPRSQRVYRNHLDMLSQHETMLILKRVLASYPCGLCQRAIHSGTPLLKVANRVEEVPDEYNIHNTSVNWNTKRLGEWQIVLSSQAYSALRSMKGSLKTREALSMKLKKLALGYLGWRVAVCNHEAPRIPLQIAKGRADMDFLCQIDLAPGPELHMEQQVVKIWAIGSQNTLIAMADEVVRFQKGLSQEHVDDCAKAGTLYRGKQHPVLYPRQGSAQRLQAPADLDIRLLNQEFIDTFNKTFTITEDMLKSIVHQDIVAEYPFDMSEGESKIIQHSGTPTLIMGRSGTGKTTCLVFKMVHKNFAMLGALPENRARQVCTSPLYNHQLSPHLAYPSN